MTQSMASLLSCINAPGTDRLKNLEDIVTHRVLVSVLSVSRAPILLFQDDLVIVVSGLGETVAPGMDQLEM